MTFSSLSLTCSFISPSSVPVISKSSWKMGNVVPLDFLCAPPLPLFLVQTQDHHPPTPFYIISKERNYFCSIIIFRACYDIIWFNFNLNVMDVRDFL